MNKSAEQVDLRIDADAMRIWAHVAPSSEPLAVEQQELLSRLAEERVDVTEDVGRRVSELASRLTSGDIPLEPVLLAEGCPATPGRDGYIEWEKPYTPHNDANYQPQQADDGSIDYYSRSNVICVKQGDCIATVIPPQEGQAGYDVRGNEVLPPKAHRAKEQFGQGTEVCHDGRVVAKMSGRLHTVAQRIWITPLLVISGDVDFESGNVSFDGEVIVEGNVLDLFSVRCTRNLAIRGLVEAATINCGGDLDVVGGINGKKKAQIEVGGKLKARFLDNATVTATGNVLILSEMVNSTLLAAEKVKVMGTIKGCRVEATGGVEAKSIGSESGVRTLIIVGNNRLAGARLAEVERELAELQQQITFDQAKVAPLVQRQQSIAESQKARLVKLLTALKETMTRADALAQQRDALTKAARVNREASVKVQEMILDGTQIQIGAVSTTIRESLRGPLTLSCSMIDGQARIVVGSGQGGMLVLESHEA